jgi:hypothetical protein
MTTTRSPDTMRLQRISKTLRRRRRLTDPEPLEATSSPVDIADADEVLDRIDQVLEVA